jgi:class 3 adenylate cyclase
MPVFLTRTIARSNRAIAACADAETRAVAAAERNGSFMLKITFRIGINIGDIIIDGDDNRGT